MQGEGEIRDTEDQWDDGSSTDPMLMGLEEEATTEDQGEAKPEAEDEKPAADVKEQVKDDPKAETPMIPKARLDQALAEKDRYKEAATYLQGIIDVQKTMISGQSPAQGGNSQAPQGNAPENADDFEALIVKAEEKKIELAAAYEDGTLSLVELEKQRNELDRQIRNHDEKRVQALFETARSTASMAVQANNVKMQIEREAIEIQKHHPYVEEIDRLPEPIKNGLWELIDQEARQALAARGIDPNDGQMANHVEFMRVKAALTDKYGPQFTGKTLAPAGGKSSVAEQRSAKLDLADQQPPIMTGTTAGGRVELTEDDIMRMSDDQLADMLETNPHEVEKVLKRSGTA